MPENNKLTPAHNYAFRSAYEFLQEMWPPVNTSEFMVTAVAKANKRYNDSNGNELLRQLINAAVNYLESEIVKSGGIQ